MAIDSLTSPVLAGTSTRPNIYHNLIDGEWVEASTSQTFENRNPADTRDVVGIFQRSGKADVVAAVDAAKQAFRKWRLVPAPRRAEIAAFIRKVVENWDAETLVKRIELQVGRDLQYIRINGTLVGGLVGLLIFTATQLL